ncbi:MAG: shikimate kinase [Candidatus Marinimicrobia bacterium]|nr:shikimate kinase [Candidatus Neomarinimicrobiota bacterium]
MKNNKKHIFLIGMMGSGKSALAKELASILNYDLIDLDQKIVEKYGKSIERIFLEEGEIVFRGYEAQTARELKISNPTVIATGGGFPVRAENRKWMKKTGKVIWLKCNSGVIFERIKNEDRPLLPKPITVEHIENILNGRTPIYTLADIIINTDRLTPKEAAKKIKSMIK